MTKFENIYLSILSLFAIIGGLISAYYGDIQLVPIWWIAGALFEIANSITKSNSNTISSVPSSHKEGGEEKP